MTELSAAIAPLPPIPQESTPDSDPQPQSPSDLQRAHLSGVWAFVLLECLIFSAYFVIYMLYRMHAPQDFSRDQAHLSPTFGLINTLLLLTSSWLVAQAVANARAGKFRSALYTTYATTGLGAVFVGSKLTEWGHEIHHGFTFLSSDFFSFYFFLTGIHIVHVLVGFIFLTIALVRLRGTEPALAALEAAAVYWHMVDLLWVIIFALLYVVR